MITMWIIMSVILIKRQWKIKMLVILVSMVTVFFFLSNNVFMLYLTFEVSLVPIRLIILGWGYQPERLPATARIIFYTITASLPLFLCLLNLRKNCMGMMRQIVALARIRAPPQIIISISLSIAFLVKVPIFLFHAWLPKAHVEAPVQGSMILAAILLKLGTYGVLLVSPFVMFNNWRKLIFRISLLGLFVMRAVCLRIWDTKVLIAYSSVSHMAAILIIIVLPLKNNSVVGTYLMVTHAFSSGGLFYVAYLFYCYSGTRLMNLTSNLIFFCPILILYFFLFVMLNIAAPPSFNLVAELLSIMYMVQILPVTIIFLLLTIMRATAYSLVLFRATSQTKIKIINIKPMLFIQDLIVILRFILPMFLVIMILN